MTYVNGQLLNVLSQNRYKQKEHSRCNKKRDNREDGRPIWPFFYSSQSCIIYYCSPQYTIVFSNLKVNVLKYLMRSDTTGLNS